MLRLTRVNRRTFLLHGAGECIPGHTSHENRPDYVLRIEFSRLTLYTSM